MALPVREPWHRGGGGGGGQRFKAEAEGFPFRLRITNNVASGLHWKKAVEKGGRKREGRHVGNKTPKWKGGKGKPPRSGV
ncbi:hypothetical protein ZHAS_00006537 [Anopheles sinensis]|uniref:Uncharacterized protein n=1 Tax=Anopheles sinensis TaxID=74873 RepID=A0A084VMK4_ANOSI|nr:hypothetical protein ZHAS_00006537 [Anopheles sinensis]